MGDALSATLHTYLPDWCKVQLTDVVQVVERVSWILYGAAAAVDGDKPPCGPEWAAVYAHDMVRDAYNNLCAKVDEYEAAETVAIDKQYEDEGWIKQENGEWHPTPEMLKEMKAGW